MTASTDQFVDIAKRSQNAMTESVRGWAETMQGFAGQFNPGGRPQMPDTGVAVDRGFDFAEQVLSRQRELAKTVLGAGQQALEVWTAQAAKAAQQVTDHAVWNGERAAESAQKATDSAAEKTRHNARTASSN